MVWYGTKTSIVSCDLIGTVIHLDGPRCVAIPVQRHGIHARDWHWEDHVEIFRLRTVVTCKCQTAAVESRRLLPGLRYEQPGAYLLHDFHYTTTLVDPLRSRVFEGSEVIGH